MNSIRFLTLLQKECMRFLKVYNQTIISPVINALIFFAIFTIAFGGRATTASGESYAAIVVTGLVAMSALQAAYQNTQATITVAKLLGFIKDYTMTPLTNAEIIIAMTLASMIRAFLVAIATYIATIPFVTLHPHNIFLALYYITAGCVVFSFVGILVGFASSDFDKAHAYTSYIITPLTMLSGTFYSITSMPSSWQKFVLLNPVFYIIEGFRFGMTGVGGNHIYGALAIFALIPIFGFLAMKVLRTGIRV